MNAFFTHRMLYPKEQHKLLQKIKSKLCWLEEQDKMQKHVAVTSQNLVQL